LLGYGRLEDPTLVEPINRIYREIWEPLQNFFLPSMKLVEKKRIGARWKRKHDAPQTAYQRLLTLGVLRPRKKRPMRDRFENLDPFVLHERLEKALRPVLAHALEAK
jgi:hypothetical protein